MILRGYTPFGPIKGVELVSIHVFDRLQERFQVYGTFGDKLCWLENRFKQAVEIQIPEQFKVLKLLDHGFKDARYFSFAKVTKIKNVIFVVQGNAIKTIHSGAAPEFKQATRKENI